MHVSSGASDTIRRNPIKTGTLVQDVHGRRARTGQQPARTA